MGQALRRLVKEHTSLMHLASDVSRLLKQSSDGVSPQEETELHAALDVFKDAFWLHFEHEQEDLFPIARRALGQPATETDRLELEQVSLLELLDELCLSTTMPQLLEKSDRFFRCFEAHLSDKAEFLSQHKYFLFPDEQMAG